MTSLSLPAYTLPTASHGRPIALLDGIRVLDLTTSIAGPYATLLLADLGATVVKIERPGTGDDVRAWGPPFLDGESLWFLSVNRNKQSVALDYSRSEGLAALHDLIAGADVVMVNQIERTQRKLGIDYETLAKLQPRLIHVSVTGFGLTGARSDLPCYDLIAEGYSGVMDLTGERDGEPQKVGTPAADLLAGMDAALATIAALFDRAKTGEGHRIDVALVESMTRFMAPRIVPYLGSGEPSTRSGGKDSVIAIYQTFQTADRPITLGLGNDNIWKRFWDAVGRPDRGADPRLATNRDRRAARVEIVAEIQEILLAAPRAHWLALFKKARIPAGPINRIDEVTVDEELIQRGLFYAAAKDDRRIPQVGFGIRIDGSSDTFRHAPPALGEHTAQVLSEWLRWDRSRIESLREQRVI